MYSNLLEAGWTMNDIDTMDIMGYMEVLAYRANKRYEEENKLVSLDLVLG